MNELADLLRDLHGRGIIRDAEIAYLPITESAVASIRADGTPVDLRGDPVRQSRSVEIRKPDGVRTWLSAYSAEDLVAKVREWAQAQEAPRTCHCGGRGWTPEVDADGYSTGRERYCDCPAGERAKETP